MTGDMYACPGMHRCGYVGNRFTTPIFVCCRLAGRLYKDAGIQATSSVENIVVSTGIKNTISVHDAHRKKVILVEQFRSVWVG